MESLLQISNSQTFTLHLFTLINITEDPPKFSFHIDYIYNVYCIRNWKRYLLLLLLKITNTLHVINILMKKITFSKTKKLVRGAELLSTFANLLSVWLNRWSESQPATVCYFHWNMGKTQLRQTWSWKRREHYRSYRYLSSLLHQHLMSGSFLNDHVWCGMRNHIQELSTLFCENPRV